MAIFEFSLMNSTARPDSTGNCFWDVLSNQGFTNSLGIYPVFNDVSSDCGFYGSLKLLLQGLTPTAATLDIQWTAAGANTASFILVYKCFDGGETVDVNIISSYDESLNDQGSAIGTTDYLTEKSITIDHTKLIDNELFCYFFGRDGDSGNDNLAADVIVLSAILRIVAS